jgi:hypothetical protein
LAIDLQRIAHSGLRAVSQFDCCQTALPEVFDAIIGVLISGLGMTIHELGGRGCERDVGCATLVAVFR